MSSGLGSTYLFAISKDEALAWTVATTLSKSALLAVTNDVSFICNDDTIHKTLMPVPSLKAVAAILGVNDADLQASGST